MRTAGQQGIMRVVQMITAKLWHIPDQPQNKRNLDKQRLLCKRMRLPILNLKGSIFSTFMLPSIQKLIGMK